MVTQDMPRVMRREQSKSLHKNEGNAAKKMIQVVGEEQESPTTKTTKRPNVRSSTMLKCLQKSEEVAVMEEVIKKKRKRKSILVRTKHRAHLNLKASQRNEEITANEETVQKRPVGRPKKISVELLPKKAVDRPKKISMELLPKKAVGRPKKISVELLPKKAVGRPKKISVEFLPKKAVGHPENTPKRHIRPPRNIPVEFIPKKAVDRPEGILKRRTGRPRQIPVELLRKRPVVRRVYTLKRLTGPPKKPMVVLPRPPKRSQRTVKRMNCSGFVEIRDKGINYPGFVETRDTEDKELKETCVEQEKTDEKEGDSPETTPEETVKSRSGRVLKKSLMLTGFESHKLIKRSYTKKHQNVIFPKDLSEDSSLSEDMIMTEDSLQVMECGEELNIKEEEEEEEEEEKEEEEEEEEEKEMNEEEESNTVQVDKDPIDVSMESSNESQDFRRLAKFKMKQNNKQIFGDPTPPLYSPQEGSQNTSGHHPTSCQQTPSFQDIPSTPAEVDSSGDWLASLLRVQLDIADLLKILARNVKGSLQMQQELTATTFQRRRTTTVGQKPATAAKGEVAVALQEVAAAMQETAKGQLELATSVANLMYFLQKYVLPLKPHNNNNNGGAGTC